VVIALALVLVSGAAAARRDAAISISASPSANQVELGGSVSFSVTATNTGPTAIDKVWVSHISGVHWTNEAMSQTGGPGFSCSHPNVWDTNCQIASFPAGATVTFTASASADQASATIGEILNARFFVFLGDVPSGGVYTGTVVSLPVVAAAPPPPPPPPPPPQRVTLGVTTVGPGTVSCGVAPCNGSIDLGASVTLTAAPTGSGVFSGWTGACSGVAPTCTLVMDSAKTVTATFESPPPPPPTPPQPPCVVPSLLGQTVAHARAAAAGRHCGLAVSKTVFSKNVLKGRVITQTPRPSTHLGNGATISVVVSRGRR
jgi:List-Bact-rpt repeat protein/PASTA domain-containing protein/uncharacterized protein DUF11